MADLLLPGCDEPAMQVPHAFIDTEEKPTTQVIVHPHPFRSYTKPVAAREGMTLAEIIAAAGIPAQYEGFLRVFVGDVEIPRAQWARVRPKAGRHVYVRATPQGGGGKNILSSILMLVVVIAAAYFAPMLAGAMGFANNPIAFAAAKGVIGAGITLLGAMAINALIPPPQQDGVGSQRALLSGVRNSFAPYADIPRHFGKRRIYPIMAAHPYTEAQGNKRFLRVLLVAGWGPLKITDLKIGETPIENFNRVTYETREGWSAGMDAFGAFPLTTAFRADLTESFAGFTANGCTSAFVDGHQRFTSNNSQPTVDTAISPGISGATNTLVRVRVRRMNDLATWRGRISWSTASHGATVGTYYASLSDPGLAVGEWAVLEFDMATATNGADWLANSIINIRPAIFNGIGGIFEIDWIEVGARKANDTEQTLFTNSVSEDNFSILLDDAGLDANGNAVNSQGPWESRFTEEGVSEISVDVNLPYGFARFTDDGDTGELTLYVDVEYRMVGNANWTSVTWAGNDEEDGTQSNGQIKILDDTRSPTSRGGRWKVPTVGQYEVRLRRASTRKLPERSYAQRIEWVTLRSIKPENPLNISGLSLIALRLEATDQLNGFPDAINCVVESYLPAYNGLQWLWTPSHNPGWAYADLMRRRGTERLIADSRIDATGLKEWAASCDENAPATVEPRWEFNGTFERGAVFTALRQVAAHGRASFLVKDGAYSVVRDVAQTVPVQHITPRNSFGYSGQKGFIEPPHGLKVQFVNKDKGYQEDEKIVYDDGYNEGNATKFESLELPGCTSPTQAWREGRYYLAVGQLRPEEHSVTMDIEHLRCTMGDLVLLSHDVLSIGQASGRITALVTSGSNTTGFVLDNEVQRDVGVSYVLRVRRANGDSELYSLAPKTGSADVTATVTLAAPIATASGPEVGDLFIYGVSTLETAPMLVKKIEPGPNLTAKLTLTDAQPGVWTADTGPIPDFQTYITETTPIPQRKPPQPSFTLRSDETVVTRLKDGTLQDRIAVRLDTLPSSKVSADTYEIQYRRTNAMDWLQALTAKVSVRQVFIAPVMAGRQYDVRVRTVTRFDIASDWTTVYGHEVIGKTTEPATVSGFTAESRVDGVQLSWTPNTEVDVVAYTIKRGETWDTASLVSNKATGNSLFVGLTVSTAQTFLIRAVDAVDLLSPSAASVTAAVVAPDDVAFFEADPQVDSIRFRWRPVSGTGVEYEIRAGDSWASGRKITQAGGNSITVKLPAKATGQRNFWIKAVSAAGLYSATPRLATVDQSPIVNQNIILEDDFSASSWAGTLANLTLNGSGVNSYLTVKKANDGLSVLRADFYKTISLATTFYARNWLETAFVGAVNNTATWQSSTLAWDEAGDLAWTGTLNGNAGCSITPYIAIADVTATPADLVEEFRLNGSTTGSNGTTPSLANSVAYGPLHIGQGVNLAQTSQLSYSLAVPSEFTMLFDFRFNGDRGTYAPYLLGILADPFTDPSSATDQAGNYLLMRFVGSGFVMNLTYNTTISAFRLTGSGQTTMDLDIDFDTGDLLTFGVSQTATERRLMIYNHRTGITASVVTDNAALGALTSFQPLQVANNKAPGVLGNIHVRSTAMTVSTFSELAPKRAPKGYKSFRELVPGDYRYQNAIVWLEIEVADRSLDVTLSEAVLNIDVPDLTQRESQTLTTASAAITFAKPFNAVPALQVTQTGGTSLALVRVTNLTATGFTVQLFDAASPATAVAGTISYTAVGY